MGTEEQLQGKYRMQAEGSDVEKLIERVAKIREIPLKEIIDPGKCSKNTEFRSMCWVTVQRIV
jgi:hypothetical protein